MVLTTGQCNQLTQLLIDYPGRADSDALALKLGIAEENLLEDLELLKKELPSLFFSEDIDQYTRALTREGGGWAKRSIWIPEQMKDQARDFLNDRGWNKHFEEKHRRIKAENDKIERRQKLEEENLIAVTRQAKNANRISWVAIAVAICSLVVSIIALW